MECGEFHGKDAQFGYTIRMFFEKEADDFDILYIGLKALSLMRRLRQFALWTVRMLERIPLPAAGAGGV